MLAVQARGDLVIKGEGVPGELSLWLEAFGARTSAPAARVITKVIIEETRHHVHVQVEEGIRGGVVWERDQSLSAVRSQDGGRQLRGDREDLIVDGR
jgi:hypothetical protein